MAAVWTGMISFGLVNIPVELHAAVKEHRPRFRLLHGKDKSPVSFQRICQREGKPVAWPEVVKGYEYKKGQFVVLTKEDFKAAALEKTKTIDVLDFVNEVEIDDRFFNTSYYALPGTGGTRAYAVLREAIRDSGRVGIGKFVLRETQHLVAVYAVSDALVLTMLHWPDELVDISRYDFPPAKEVRPKELEMAKVLVENLSGPWDARKYKDEYIENLMRVIQAKVKGRKPEVVGEPRPADPGVIDLMERLRKSLEAGRKPRKTPARRGARTAQGRRRAA
ncbi:MAG: Ku protein [Candidatus Binatia bacterium]